MEHWRKVLWRLTVEQAEGSHSLVVTAARAAVAWLWVCIGDFCTTPAAMEGDVQGWAAVPQHHPFIAPARESGRLVAARPAGL